ncbi:MAG TPA: response regulator, partial [Xenococcaceae cyanobacterium]
MKILLVEDDEFIAQTLENILRDQHYIVDCAAEGQLGWEYVETYNYDLILLDIILPKLDGIEFCKRLRSEGNQTPVLLITAQNSSNKKVIGLDAGADDYVVKPFEISELLARIRVLLRRRNSLVSPILQWENLRLNSSTHEVTYNEKFLTLTPKEYRLLELFLDNGDRVLTRDLILERLWDVEEAPSNNTVSAHIKDLRRKLKQAGAKADLIETIYGVGYRLKPLTETNQTVAETELGDLEENKEQRLRQQTATALTAVWQKFKNLHSDRLIILEQVNHSWQKQTLSKPLLEQAQLAAHKLAGGLGVFGFTQGSRLAVEIEQLLKIQSTPEPERARHFSELLVALKDSLKTEFDSQVFHPLDFHPNSNSISEIGDRPVILAVDNHPKLVEQMMAEMTANKMQFQLVTKPIALKKALAQTNLEVIIWQFTLSDRRESSLVDFAQIINGKSPLPVILFSDSNAQSDRLKLLRLSRH